MNRSDARRTTLRDRGQLTLPLEVRRALHIDAGDDVEFVVVDDGTVVMRGLKMIPADQAWFWADTWQKGEREATADIANGRVETFKDEQSFVDFIQSS